MKPYLHAKNSAKRYGGVPEDYLEIHNFFDSTKSAYADVRHRAVLHSAFGIFLVEKVFGTTITNSDGKLVQVRDVGEDHVVEDLGFIPSIEKWLKDLPLEEWMSAKGQAQFKKRTKVPLQKHTEEGDVIKFIPPTEEDFYPTRIIPLKPSFPGPNPWDSRPWNPSWTNVQVVD